MIISSSLFSDSFSDNFLCREYLNFLDFIHQVPYDGERGFPCVSVPQKQQIFQHELGRGLLFVQVPEQGDTLKIELGFLSPVSFR